MKRRLKPLREIPVPDVVLAAGFVAVFAYAVATLGDWPFKAQLMPLVFSLLGLLFSGSVVAGAVLTGGADPAAPDPDRTEAAVDSVAAARGRGLRFFASCIAYAALVPVFGVLPGLAMLMLYLLVCEGKQRWPLALILTAAVMAGSYVLFHMVVHLPWPNALIGDVFPALRAWFPTDIV